MNLDSPRRKRKTALRSHVREQVRAAILETPGVAGLHDRHVWSITTGRVCLSVHVVAERMLPRGELLGRVAATLRGRFGIGHTTIQVEPVGYEDCGNATCEADAYSPGEPQASARGSCRSTPDPS